MALTRSLATLVLVAALTLPAGTSAAPEPANMTQAQVNDTLRNTPELWNALYLAAVVNEIARRCDDLRGPGRFERTRYFLALYNQARRLGFSRAQLEAFVEDQSERARMTEQVQAYVRSKGARIDNPVSICALGRAEMAAGTPVGQRLSER